MAPPAPPDIRSAVDARRRGDRGLVVGYCAVAVALALVAATGPVREHKSSVLIGLSFAGCAWWWTVRCARSRALSWGRVWLGAALLRALALAADPQVSDDIHRYVWEGELLRRGISPYAWAPDAPRLEGVREQLPQTYARLNNRDVSAAYPPVTEGACALAVAAARGIGDPSQFEARARWTLRLLFTACDLAALAALGRWLAARGRPAGDAVAWAWSPLAALEFAGSGHFDSLGIALWVGALAGASSAAARPAARVRDCALLAGATLVKYLPAGSAPFLVRSQGGSRGVLTRAALLAVMLAAPFAALFFLDGGTSGLWSGLSEYGKRWESQSLLYRFVEGGLARWLERDDSWRDVRVVSRAAVGAVWIAAAAWLFVRRVEVGRACALLTGLFLLLSPVLHPWYLTWMLPFVAVFPSAAWCYLIAAAPLLYWPIDGWQLTGVWREPAWLWPVLALPFFALLVRELRSPAPKA